MSGKVKMRCAHCGKPFKSANAKQILCADCEVKERAARAASKSAVKPTVVTPTLVIKPKIVGAGARILDPSLPPERAPAPVAHEHPAERRTDTPRPDARPAAPRDGAPTPPPGRPQGVQSGPRRSQPRPDASGERPRKPKPPRTPREPQRPFELTHDQVQLIEARYLELATPIEFDGIRTQIATELSVPKVAVKKAIAELRQRMQMPSWWELQAYKGSDADLERVRQAYAPLLPMPEIGVHKRLATELNLDQAIVYQAIRRIRAELRLPQYNARDLNQEKVPAAITAETSSAEAR